MKKAKNVDAPVNTSNLTPEEDYSKNFLPSVHRIGRTSMVAAMVLAFLPVLYLLFVKGYTLPGGYYITGITTCVSMGLATWISEPLTYWPIMGSAATYMGYMAGNVRNVRWATVTAVQRETNSDASTPRGQVLAILGVGASVVMCLVILLLTVLGGEWLLSVLPSVVTGAFAFSICTLMGAMLMMRLDLGQGITKGFTGQILYILAGVIVKLFMDSGLFSYTITQFGALFAVVAGILVAYYAYRRDLAKAETAEQSGEGE